MVYPSCLTFLANPISPLSGVTLANVENQGHSLSSLLDSFFVFGQEESTTWGFLGENLLL